MERDIIKGKGRFILKESHCLKIDKKHIKVRCCSFNAQKGLLILGTQNGSFQLLRLQKESIETLQEFQIAEYKISKMELNISGNWVAMGVKENGQLLVWEWRSQ